MQKSKYSVIVFDLGNVLIPFDYKPMIEKFENIQTGLGQKFIQYYKDNYYIHRDFERGNISDDVFINMMLNVLNNKIDAEIFCNYYSQIFTVNQDVASLLPILKNNFMLVLLSNTNSIHRQYGWKNFEFLKHFDKLILSHEVHAVKPEPKIYKAVEAFTKQPAGEHIFIDDILEYVEGAKKIGWDSVQYTGYDILLSDLKARDIL